MMPARVETAYSFFEVDQDVNKRNESYSLLPRNEGVTGVNSCTLL
jgi:hypothetical protein